MDEVDGMDLKGRWHDVMIREESFLRKERQR